MNIAFIIDPIDSLNPAKDSTIAMMQVAAARGHRVWAIGHDAVFADRKIMAEACQLQLWGSRMPWYSEIERDTRPLADFDVVLMRKDPPFDMEYVALTWLLQRAEAEGARVFNRPRALRDHSEKLSILEFPQFTVPQVVSCRREPIDRFIDSEKDVILKPLDGMGGREIFRVGKNDPNRNAILETLTRDETRTIMAQRYIPEISAGDKRVLLVGGRVVPFCLARIPKPGETRGNLASGGTGVAQRLSARDLEIAEALASVLFMRGLLLVGLDIIGDYLTEINVTSPTCMVEIYKQSGCNVATMVIEALEATCSGSNR